MNQPNPISEDLDTLLRITLEDLSEAQIRHLHSIQVSQELYLVINEREEDIYPRETDEQKERRERLRALLCRIPGYSAPNLQRDAWVWLEPLQELLHILRDGQRRYPERISLGRSIAYVENLLEEQEWNLEGGESHGEWMMGERPHGETEQYYASLNQEREEIMETLRNRSIPTLLVAVETTTLADDDRECSICQTIFGMYEVGPDHQASRLPCGHYFGNECITRWLQTNSTCPICRRDYQKQLVDLGILTIPEVTRLGQIPASLGF